MILVRHYLTALALLLAACSGVATQATTSTTQALSSSTTAPPSTTTSSSASTTTTSSTTTTTSAVPAGVAVVASLGAVMGVWNGEWQVIEDSADLPPTGPDWQVFEGVGQDIVSVAGEVTGDNFYCDPAPYERPIVDLSEAEPAPFWLAVQADWPLVPHKVEDFTGQLDVYIDAVIALLAGQGLTVDTVHLDQLIRTDLEGDGVDEVIIVATEGPRPDIFTPKTDRPFELVALRRIVQGEVQTAILELRLPDDIGTDFPFLNDFEVLAVADLNGDSKMEIALRGFYYEGAWLDVWEYVDDDLGPVPVLSIGCGA